MPKTTKLQLPIVTDDSTLFEDWRKSINGNVIDSAFQIIDDFAVEVYEALSSGGGGLTPEQEAKLSLIKDNGVGDKYLADDGTYKVVSGGGGDGIDLNMLGYMNYAADIFYRGRSQSLFANAWEHSLTVTSSEISANGSSSNNRGKAQYPNGENEGVIIPQGVTNIGTHAFRNWEANTHPLVIPNSVTSIGLYAFYNWSANNHPLIIPNSVTSIGGSAFSGWKANNHPLVIPNSVTSIRDYVFRGWEANNHPLVIPNSVTEIRDFAFYNWSANNHPLIIPNSVTSIGDSAFSDWTLNTHPLVIPNSVTSIRAAAFYNWTLVPYVEIQAITPPTLAGNYAFSGQNDAPIYVPDESVDDYKEATNWVSLASRIFSINDK